MASSKLAKAIANNIVKEVKHNRLVTPLVINYRIAQGRNAQYTSDEGIDIVTKLLKEQNSRINSRSKRTSYSGGSAGGCMREQALNIAMGQGGTKEPSYGLSLIFEDGNWRNLKWIVEFERMGILKAYEQTNYNPKINLSWTPDARLDLSKYYGKEYSDVPCEIKGMNDREFKEFRRRSGRGNFASSRIMQIHAYMIAEDKDYWLIFAENKNTQDIEEYWCKRDPGVVKLLQAKYAYMLRADKLEVLPAIECGMDNSDRKFTRCSRSEECQRRALNGYPSLPPLKKREKMEKRAKQAFV